MSYRATSGGFVENSTKILKSYVFREMSTTWDVELYIYDLSQGVAAMMSEPLLGKFQILAKK